MSIIQMSIESSILIIIIIILRSLGMYYLPKKSFVIMWSIVLGKLLIPFYIPIKYSKFMSYVGNKSYRLGQISSSEKVTWNHSLQSHQVTASIPKESVNYFFYIWLLGMFICVFILINSFIRSSRMVKESLPLDNKHINKWLKNNAKKRNLKVYKSDQIGSPLNAGIFKSKIILPTWLNLANEERLDYILSHEYVHITRCDNLLKLILLVAVCIHWFNPLVWIMYILFNRDIEISCDEKVVLRNGETNKYSYANTLISLAENKTGYSTFTTSFAKTSIEERIGMIMKFKKLSFKSLGIAAIALVLVGGITFLLSTSPIVEVRAGTGGTTKSEEDSVDIYIPVKHDEVGNIAYYTYKKYK